MPKSPPVFSEILSKISPDIKPNDLNKELARITGTYCAYGKAINDLLHTKENQQLLFFTIPDKQKNIAEVFTNFLCYLAQFPEQQAAIPNPFDYDVSLEENRDELVKMAYDYSSPPVTIEDNSATALTFIQRLHHISARRPEEVARSATAAAVSQQPLQDMSKICGIL